MRRIIIITGILIIIFIALAGCMGKGSTSSYSVDNNGLLSVSCAPVTTSEQVLFTNGNFTKSKVVMHTQEGDVVTYLAAPRYPKAVIVYAPGAGEKLAGHEERMERYAAAGFAFLLVDIRGNGAETQGYPFNPRQDFYRFEKGNWPQYYLTVCDLVTARQMLSGRFGVPIYAMGSSNGGRYAAVAAGVDPEFSGYVGISTSDWGVLDSAVQQGYSGNLIRFAASLEPGTYVEKISPRPVWIFHAPNDPIITFDQGKRFFERAKEPKTFIEFSGEHGINADVDERIILQWAQIYGTQE